MKQMGKKNEKERERHGETEKCRGVDIYSMKAEVGEGGQKKEEGK